MEHFGVWGLIPPILTIVLAFVTKDVIISLFIGIFSGAFIVAGFNPFSAMLNVIDLIAGSLNDGWNIRIFLFCALLGGLVGMLNTTGATSAFGRWVGTKIRGRQSSQLMAVLFGALIFIDDYFNSLAVGTIMRPITDDKRVSRAKLAYILDSTAAPICILAPVSSWVITVMSIVKNSEGFEALNMTPFEFFITSIPYNIYAILSIVMVLAVIITRRDYGPMQSSERRALEREQLFNEAYGPASGDLEALGTNERSRAFDMVFPILVLIVSAVVLFPLTTYRDMIDGSSIANFSQAFSTMSITEAFSNTDASKALFYSAVITVVITYIYYVSRRLLTIKSASTSLRDGIGSMVPALIILTLAWTIGSVIRNSPEDGGLALAKYLSHLVEGGHFTIILLPVIIFVSSALISFATGTSWGTFAIMIPITMPIAVAMASASPSFVSLVTISVSAVLGGAVFGDHASPISDTTILSSTGAACPHLEHVATQMPYAVSVAIITAVSYLFAGIFGIWVGWLVALLGLAGTLYLGPKFLNRD